jgi:hypothetical protein
MLKSYLNNSHLMQYDMPSWIDWGVHINRWNLFFSHTNILSDLDIGIFRLLFLSGYFVYFWKSNRLYFLSRDGVNLTLDLTLWLEMCTSNLKFHQNYSLSSNKIWVETKNYFVFIFTKTKKNLKKFSIFEFWILFWNGRNFFFWSYFQKSLLTWNSVGNFLNY